MIKQRIHEYLLNCAHRKVFQVEIAERLNCTQMHVSKTIRELKKKGIITKEGKNAVAVINPFLLCANLAYETEKEKPLYFQAPDFEDIMQILKKTKYYAITSESAKIIKNNKIPKIITARILNKDLPLLKEYFNEVIKPEKANLIIYLSNIMKFMLTQNHNEIELANEWQLMYDLIRENKMKI
ncbi:MAG: helix-turn-helix domain-containing protein [Candidatus Nanoarchaeia archaeon]|nr:helix-turn-helix domain-containing protein [Candidatus Nanoarchaeia archaeon]